MPRHAKVKTQENRCTLRTKAEKSVPHAVHFETASSGTYVKQKKIKITILSITLKSKY